jgi:hypothetical protein
MFVHRYNSVGTAVWDGMKWSIFAYLRQMALGCFHSYYLTKIKCALDGAVQIEKTGWKAFREFVEELN